MSKLESLDGGLYQPLTAHERRELLGGSSFTYRGVCGQPDDTFTKDFDEDPRAV
jgi:hypothetical protein